MKTIQIFIVLVCLLPVSVAYSQIQIGGVSVDVSIDIPIPDVVVIGRKPSPKVVIEPREQVVVHTSNHYETISFGEIQNQNGPYGRQIYQVVDAALASFHNGLETITYHLNSGDVLELVIATANSNDYNYHSYDNCSCEENNRIIKVVLNNQQIALRDGSVSLQPKANGFHSVLNLHTQFEGDFNGTVNF